jgi:hypothetical protein
MQKCEKCQRNIEHEEPVYEVRFGFLYIGDSSGITPTQFEEDGEAELYHGLCIGLEARRDGYPCGGK